RYQNPDSGRGTVGRCDLRRRTMSARLDIQATWPGLPAVTPLLERYHLLRAAIAEAARTAGREAEQVELVAVSKTHPAEAIEPLPAAGHRRFGENRVQEAQLKYPALREAHPALQLHLIGPLQTNKARQAVKLFDVIETLDRPKLALTLAEE